MLRTLLLLELALSAGSELATLHHKLLKFQAPAFLVRVGTGAVQCGTATINGIGIVSGNITGTGGLASQSSVVSGEGTVYSPVTITGTGALVCGSSSVSGYDATAIWIEVSGVTTTWTEI